jgi:hypothetical protein
MVKFDIAESHTVIVHDRNDRLLTPANEIKDLPVFTTHALKYFDQ